MNSTYPKWTITTNIYIFFYTHGTTIQSHTAYAQNSIAIMCTHIQNIFDFSFNPGDVCKTVISILKSNNPHNHTHTLNYLWKCECDAVRRYKLCLCWNIVYHLCSVYKYIRPMSVNRREEGKWQKTRSKWREPSYVSARLPKPFHRSLLHRKRSWAPSYTTNTFATTWSTMG